MTSYGSVERKVRSESEGGSRFAHHDHDVRNKAQSPDELPLIWKEKTSSTDKDGTAAHNNQRRGSEGEGGHYTMFHYLVYAAINVIIAVPGLYG